MTLLVSLICLSSMFKSKVNKINKFIKHLQKTFDDVSINNLNDNQILKIVYGKDSLGIMHSKSNKKSETSSYTNKKKEESTSNERKKEKGD